jgi:amino acid transporter
MVAMLFTALSYGRMANVYPSYDSAYCYVSSEIQPGPRLLTDWSITLDCVINPIVYIIRSAKAASNFDRWAPYWMLVLALAPVTTVLNLRGVETSARVNQWLASGMALVVFLFLAATVLSISFSLGAEPLNFGSFIAFTGVTAAAFIPHCVRGKRWSLGYIIPPFGGIFCLFPYLAQSRHASEACEWRMAFVRPSLGAIRGNLGRRIPFQDTLYDQHP